MSRLVSPEALAGQSVVIGGASSGIGLALAQLAARAGAASVVMIGRTASRLDAAVASVGPRARGLALDLLDAAAVEAALSKIGQIDHLVATAVSNEYGLFGELGATTAGQLEASFDKLRGFVHLTRAAAPRLAASGSITLLSGAGAARPPRNTALAAAANGSVVSFGRALAVELAPRRVNVVMPGPVDTPLHGEARGEVAAWARSLPAGHFGQPEDIAEAIALAMTNPYLTGHTLIIDGGYLGH